VPVQVLDVSCVSGMNAELCPHLWNWGTGNMVRCQRPVHPDTEVHQGLGSTIEWYTGEPEDVLP